MGGVPRVVTRVVGAVKVSVPLWVRAGSGTDLKTAVGSPQPGRPTSAGPQRFCRLRAAPGPTRAVFTGSVFTGSAPAQSWPRPTPASAADGQAAGLRAAGVAPPSGIPLGARRPLPGAGTGRPHPHFRPTKECCLRGWEGTVSTTLQGFPSPFLPGPTQAAPRLPESGQSTHSVGR